MADDDSLVELDGTEIGWSVADGPIQSISAGGLATAGSVFEDTTANIAAMFGGITENIEILVLDTLFLFFTPVSGYAWWAGLEISCGCFNLSWLGLDGSSRVGQFFESPAFATVRNLLFTAAAFGCISRSGPLQADARRRQAGRPPTFADEPTAHLYQSV